MKPLKVSLIGLVVLLAITVAYGYGCGGGDDKSGSGGATSAAETDGSTGDGESTESTESEDGTSEDGDGTSEDGDGGPLTKAAYIKQGDAICEKVPQRYEEAATKLGEEAQKQGKPQPKTPEVNLKAAVPPLYTAIEEFEDLSPPSGEEQQAEEMIDALEAAAKGVEAKPNSELAGPQSPFAEYQKLAREYGFKLCSQL